MLKLLLPSLGIVPLDRGVLQMGVGVELAMGVVVPLGVSEGPDLRVQQGLEFFEGGDERLVDASAGSLGLLLEGGREFRPNVEDV